MKAKVTALIRLALDRAESLKGLKREETNDIIKTLSQLPPVPETNLDVDVDKASTITITSTSSNNTGNKDSYIDKHSNFFFD